MLAGVAAVLTISIHTLRVEGDVCMGLSLVPITLFQSTPSVWRVTGEATLNQAYRIANFNPHPPCGG